MYCKRCYADLSAAPEPKCPNCGRPFAVNAPGTYLKRPFPGAARIALHVALTTAFATAAAFVVGLHQMARSSGH